MGDVRFSVINLSPTMLVSSSPPRHCRQRLMHGKGQYWYGNQGFYPWQLYEYSKVNRRGTGGVSRVTATHIIVSRATQVGKVHVIRSIYLNAKNTVTYSNRSVRHSPRMDTSGAVSTHPTGMLSWTRFLVFTDREAKVMFS